jgi:predicted transcriptional regulator
MGEEGQKTLLGLLLVHKGYITYEQLDIALEKQKETKQRLGDILVELGFIDRETLEKVIG